MDLELADNNPIKRTLFGQLAHIPRVLAEVLVGMELIPDSLQEAEVESEDKPEFPPAVEFANAMKQLRDIQPQIGNVKNSPEKENKTIKIYRVLKKITGESDNPLFRIQACKDAGLKLLITCLDSEIKMLGKLIDKNNKSLWAGADEAIELAIRKNRNLSETKITMLVQIIKQFLLPTAFNPQGEVMCDICLIMTQDVPLESFEGTDHDCLDNFGCLGKLFIKMMISVKELLALKVRGDSMNLAPAPPKFRTIDMDEAKPTAMYDENGFRIDNTAKLAAVKEEKPVAAPAKVELTLSGKTQNDNYRSLLKEKIFSYSNFDYDEKICGKSSDCSPDVVKRITKEIQDLKNQLPAEASHSIYVVAHSKRIDVMKALIIGAEGTPYAHGAFEFIVYCGGGYPAKPPKVLLLTTGFGTVRFNPNLYACGKVCLSILGTWSGRNASENWNPSTSTLSQVLLSIQSLVMCDGVYYNEPGYERYEGTAEGEKRNIAYSNVVRLNNINYGMLNQIINPPEGFEDIIKLHFALKKDAILRTIEEWEKLGQQQNQAVYDGLVLGHNPWAKSLTKAGAYLQELRDLKSHAYSEMKAIKPPES